MISLQGPDPLTDNECAKRVNNRLVRLMAGMRQTLNLVQATINEAPGGKAGLVASLGGDAPEVVNACLELTTFLNAHAPAPASSPLVLGDLP